MRKVLFMTLAMCLLMAGVATAQSKIAVVDVQALANDSEPAKDAVKRMERKFSAEGKQLETQAKELQKSAESMKDPKTTEDKRVQFLKDTRAFEEKRRAFAIKREQENRQITQELMNMIFQACEAVAKRGSYDVVMNVSSGSVLYAVPQMDITNDVKAEVNKIFKSGGAKK